MISAQQQRRGGSFAATRATCAAKLPDLSRSRQCARQWNSQAHHDDLQRIAMPMRRRLDSVSDTAQNAVDQLKIRETIAKAFDSRERLDKRFVQHVSPQPKARKHLNTTVRYPTHKLLTIRRGIASCPNKGQSSVPKQEQAT
jgi:hypothetical protein